MTQPSQWLPPCSCHDDRIHQRDCDSRAHCHIQWKLQVLQASSVAWQHLKNFNYAHFLVKLSLILWMYKTTDFCLVILGFKCKRLVFFNWTNCISVQQPFLLQLGPSATCFPDPYRERLEKAVFEIDQHMIFTLIVPEVVNTSNKTKKKLTEKSWNYKCFTFFTERLESMCVSYATFLSCNIFGSQKNFSILSIFFKYSIYLL